MRLLNLFFKTVFLLGSFALIVVLDLKEESGYDNLVFPRSGLVINMNLVIGLLIVLEVTTLFLAWFSKPRSSTRR